jgi:hypothetical protein
MFRPDEIIFAPTGRCNLTCAHCRAMRTPGPLSADAAVELLRSAREGGVERVGFSGGEPFLEPDFLRRTTAAAVELDLVFDRAMTNAVWYRDEAHLRSTLETFFEAGFDGTFGVSVDAYHGQSIDRLLPFFRAVFEIWGRRDCCEIVWATSPDDDPLFGKFAELAAALGGTLVFEDGLPAAIVDPPEEDGSDDDSGYDDPAALRIRFDRIPFSPPAESAPWSDPEWFEDDFCAGPGNVFYVHPDGRIAVCCGFANERDDLIVGRLGEDDFGSLMENARNNRHVRDCYEAGLGAVRGRLEKRRVRFPGKTADICVFCDHLCARGLAGKQ